ncbi:MAG TPA: DUF3223 domain-containing protein [Allosphingosinicella sp.]|jgi:hypothetical protein
MPAKPLVLPNGKAFASRGEAENHFLEMRTRYSLNTPIDHNADHEDLLALLERYDDAIHDGPSKIGAGIAHFETRMNRTNGGTNLGFWAIRVDNSETDFSIFKAIAARGSTEAQQFSNACRVAVADDLNDAKRVHFETWGDAVGTVECEATSARIERSEARADYVVTPFRDIVHNFRVAQGWEERLPDGVITKPSDAQTITKFEDPIAAAAFRKYHHYIAQVRVVAKGAPTALLRAGRGNPPLRPLKF